MEIRDRVDGMLENFEAEKLFMHSSGIAVMYRLCRAVSVFEKAQMQKYDHAKHALEEAELLALLLLNGADHQMTPKQLAETMYVSPANMTAKLTRLEQAGLIRRERNHVDRRSVGVTLTDAGTAMAKVRIHEMNSAAGDVLEAINPECVEALSSSLRSLLVAHNDVIPSDSDSAGESESSQLREVG